MQSVIQMKYKMKMFWHLYFAEQCHVFRIERVGNEQNSGILRITSRMIEISLIPGLSKLEQMDLAYTHEPSRRIMGLVGTRGLHLYLRTLEAAVEDEIVTDDEMSILRVIARAFALPDDVMSNAWDILRNQIDNPVNPTDVHAHEKRQIGDATTYQTALIAALVGEIITEDEWSKLRAALGRPDWSDLERMRRKWSRLSEQDEIDRHIGFWCEERTSKQVFSIMRRFEVPCGIVKSPEEMQIDPQLRHRGHYWELEHPTMGKRTYDGPSFRLSKTPGELTKASPLLGEDNERIFTQLLNIDEEEYNLSLIHI